MSTLQIIATELAPTAIGPYSQAVRFGPLVYLSGQLPLEPQTMRIVDGIDAQVRQVLRNLEAITQAAGGSLADAVKLTVYLTDLENAPAVNDAMSTFFRCPYPARAMVGVAALPRGALIAVDAVLALAEREG